MTTYVIQLVAEPCPINLGQERTFNTVTGLTQYLVSQSTDPLHGLFMIPGDLPTMQSEVLVCGSPVSSSDTRVCSKPYTIQLRRTDE